MNKKVFTAVLCVLVIAIVILSVAMFSNLFKKDEPIPVPDTQTAQDSDQQTEDETTDEQTENETETTDEQTEESTENNETKPSESETDNKTEESTKKEEPEKEEPEVTVTTKPVPTDYKSFSLTKGMTASEAYEYLNGFLNSKYSILVNKQNKVGSDYEPSNLKVPSGCDYKMEQTAGDALVKMMSAAKADGIYDLVLYSGYRTVASQKSKYETRTQRYLDQGYSQAQAEAKAGEYIAPPGASEHHTGFAADVCSSAIVSKYGYLSDDFDSTKEFKWLKSNCHTYGFILRYTKEDEDITGYLYEPWHYRYIGVEHATACTELGLTYEEYHSMLIKFRDAAKIEAGV